MFKMYIKIAIRNILKNKVLFFINISGLALGMAAVMLLLLNIQYEYSVDQFHQNKKNIHKAYYKGTVNGKLECWDYTSASLAPALNEDYPGIKKVTRISGTVKTLGYGDKKIMAGGDFTYNQTKNSLTPQANTEVRTYTVSSNGKIYFPAKIVLSYDVNKTFNSGYGVSANPFIINGYLERQFSKNNQFSIRLQAYDLLNQNTSISRTVNANSITDTRTNKLGQYFMVSFNFRLQKFKGQQPRMQFPSGPPPDGPAPIMRSN